MPKIPIFELRLLSKVSFKLFKVFLNNAASGFKKIMKSELVSFAPRLHAFEKPKFTLELMIRKSEIFLI